MLFKTPELKTDRLILMSGTIADFLNVYEYNLKNIENTKEDFEYDKLDLEVTEIVNSEIEDAYDWIIYLNDTSEPIGNIIADCENKYLNSLELSFNLHPKYWGNGYMKEALIEVMKFLFDNNYDNIICRYDEGNENSKRLQEKIGFELYRIEQDCLKKDGVSITSYIQIMTKDKFFQLYGSKVK